MKKIISIGLSLLPLIAISQNTENKNFITMPFEAGEKMRYDEAIKTCETLERYGHNNWRLPTLEELQAAFHDEEHFIMRQDWYWSGDEKDKIYAWCIKKNGESYFKRKTEEMYPRCIRDFEEINVQTSNKKVGQEYHWEEAKSYCANLVDNDHDDWRLPEIDELLYIYKKGEVIDFDMNVTRAWSTWFWSNSEDYDEKVWTILLHKDNDFHYKVSRERKKTKFETVCVRSNQQQTLTSTKRHSGFSYPLFRPNSLARFCYLWHGRTIKPYGLIATSV